MRSLFPWLVILSALAFPLGAKAEIDTSFYEEAGEYIRIEVEFNTADSGVILGFTCPDCRPERFIFNYDLMVESREGRMGVQSLKKIHGKAAVIFYRPDTHKALRIMPMQ